MICRSLLLMFRRSSSMRRHLVVLFVLSTTIYAALYLRSIISDDATSRSDFGRNPRSKFRYRSRHEWQLENNRTYKIRNVELVLSELQSLAASRTRPTRPTVNYLPPRVEDRSNIGRTRRNKQLAATYAETSRQVGLSPVKTVANSADGLEVPIETDNETPGTSFRRKSGDGSIDTTSTVPPPWRVSYGIDKLHGGPGKCKVYNVRRTISEIDGADFSATECVPLDARVIMRFNSTVQKPLLACPYPDAVDSHLSMPLRVHHVWEPHIVNVFLATVRWMVSAAKRLRAADSYSASSSTTVGVFDIGANVGQYSLLAAGIFECRVVAVEPYKPNIYRLHKAAELNKLTASLTVVENAVSNVRDTFELSISSGNPSAVKLTSQDADRFCTEPGCPAHATTILMDDLLEVTNFDLAIMKMDIEGHEHRALIHSDQLFAEVNITYIFMEWTRMREFYGSEVDNGENKQMVQQLIDRLTDYRGYTAYGLNDLLRLEPRYWYGWPNDIVWVHRDVLPPRQLLESSNIL